MALRAEFNNHELADLYAEIQQVMIGVLRPEEKLRRIQEMCENFLDLHRDALIGRDDILVPLLRNAYQINSFKIPEDKFRSLKKVDVETPLEDCCGICCENHTMVQCITTQCGHCFGKKCFQRWENTRRKSRLSLTCPMCNTVVSTLTNYLPRKDYKPIEKSVAV